jgi:hypothetical protein
MCAAALDDAVEIEHEISAPEAGLRLMSGGTSWRQGSQAHAEHMQPLAGLVIIGLRIRLCRS